MSYHPIATSARSLTCPSASAVESHPGRKQASGKRHARLIKFLALSLGLAVTGLSPFGSPSAQAASLTWNSAGPNNNWSTSAGNTNWLPGPTVWVQNSDAVFDSGAESVDVTTTNSFNNITFGITGFTVTNGTGNLDIDSTD